MLESAYMIGKYRSETKGIPKESALTEDPGSKYLAIIGSQQKMER